MNGRTESVAKSGRAQSFIGIACAACLALALSGCQAANQAMDQAHHAYEQNSLTGNIDHLAPWIAPDKSKGIIVQFLPFSGVPVNTADAIYKSVRSRAADENISLALRLDEPATYRVRTLINAVGTTDMSTFVFVVEIYDVAGNRMHRFVGQEYGVAPNGEPWSGIDSDTERHLGERILLAVKAWLTRLQ
jgi:hypothetical protein